jgi:hypothetical protein
LLCCVFVLFVFVLCLVYPMFPVSLDCPFLIAPSVFSNVYFTLLRNLFSNYLYLRSNISWTKEYK